MTSLRRWVFDHIPLRLATSLRRRLNALRLLRKLATYRFSFQHDGRARQIAFGDELRWSIWLGRSNILRGINRLKGQDFNFDSILTLNSTLVLPLISDIIGSSTVESRATGQLDSKVYKILVLLAERAEGLQPTTLFDLSRLLAGHGMYSRALQARDLAVSAVLSRREGPADATLIAVLIERNLLNEAREAIAARRAAGLETTRLQMMVSVLSGETLVRHGDGTQFAEFSRELRGRSVCLVGPAATSLDISRLDVSGTVLALIKRIDLPDSASGILYLNSLHSSIVARECRRVSARSRYKRFGWIVGKFERTNNVPSRVRELVFKPVVPFRSPSIAPRAIADLSIAGASSVRLSGFSLYLGSNAIDFDNHLRSQQAVFAGRAYMRTTTWANQSHAAHDLFGQFLLLQNLWQHQLIVPDSTLSSILKMTVESYAQALDHKYSPRSG